MMKGEDNNSAAADAAQNIIRASVAEVYDYHVGAPYGHTGRAWSAESVGSASAVCDSGRGEETRQTSENAPRAV